MNNNFDRSRGSVGGVTVDNSWMYNNPDLIYPEGHESMDEDTLRSALLGQKTDLFCDFVNLLSEDEFKNLCDKVDVDVSELNLLRWEK